MREAQNIDPSNVFPRPDLGPSDEWARNVMDRVIALEKEALANRAGTTGINRNVAASTANLADQIAYLYSLQSYEYAEFTTGFLSTGAGWQTSPCSVTISSPTGRLRLTYGGSLNGGDAYICYQVTGVSSGTLISRSTLQSNPARRVAVSGGASFAPSGFTTTVIDVPVDEEVTISLELYASSAFEYFFGGSISAQVIP